jgi:hypothetical protein
MTKTLRKKIDKLAQTCSILKQSLQHNMTIEKVRSQYPFNYRGDHISFLISRQDLPCKVYICVRNDGHLLQKKRYKADDTNLKYPM